MGAISHSIARTTVRQLQSTSRRSFISSPIRSTELPGRYIAVTLEDSQRIPAFIPKGAPYLKSAGQSIVRSRCEVGRKHFQLPASSRGFVGIQYQGKFYQAPQSCLLESLERPGHSRRALAMASPAPASTSDSKVEDAESFKGKVKLAVCQLSVGADKRRNIDHAREVIEKAVDDGARLIVLPEMWNCPYSNDSFPTYAEDIDGGASPSADMLSVAAKSKKVTIIGGSIPERSKGKLYNTCCVYGPDGKLLGKHRKMHLFDIDIPGKITFKESDTLSPGNAFTIVKTDVGCIGVGICYDIRFPELAMLSAAKGAQILCYPGAFNMTTGPLHWELLAKARAVDNQLFVVTCSPARDDGAGYIAWGHSTVIGPFGKVEAALEEKEGVLLLDIDLSEIETRRTNMPLESQRRHDVYRLVEITDRNRSAL